MHRIRTIRWNHSGISVPDKSKVSLFAHHASHTGDTGRPNRGFEHQYDLINATYENRLSQDVTLNFKVGYRQMGRRQLSCSESP
ncbi:MAG TPA: hypothetical protein VLH56_09010 [Dissulfurispiraceae bacterium]|nr:hypothetical protein [Dissulfurispiraceae bacterium]